MLVLFQRTAIPPPPRWRRGDRFQCRNHRKQNKMTIRVSYKFAKEPDTELNDTAGTVLTEMTGNATFPTPPTTATLAMLDAANLDFTEKINKAQMGGPMATTAKNLSRQTLLGIMKKLGGYVQITANNMEELLSSGFEARSENHARQPLEQPTGVKVKNGTTGQLIVGIAKPVKNTNLYEGRASSDGGTTWLPSVFTGDSRHIIFEGLTPGDMYTFQVRALGGSTGQSDWSDPVSHRSM
jgi:hypothetical protein